MSIKNKNLSLMIFQIWKMSLLRGEENFITQDYVMFIFCRFAVPSICEKFWHEIYHRIAARTKTKFEAAQPRSFGLGAFQQSSYIFAIFS